MNSLAKKRAENWLTPYFDETSQEKVRSLLQNSKELEAAFGQNLSFGTGGLRAIMGVGTNRLNRYTIRAATQGLATYLIQQNNTNKPVLIGYDVRHNSKEFALEAARVLAANNLSILLMDEVAPTPLISFGCRHMGCSAAIVITASHNTAEYNGYKIYSSDGVQIVTPNDDEIKQHLDLVRIETVTLSPIDSPLIKKIGKELDAAYLKELKNWQLFPSEPLRIIYTPLHGTGLRIIPDALKSWGYKDIELVEAQKKADGNFTHAPQPNPEDPKALQLGSDQLILSERDILIATDPDADRIGIVIRHRKKAVLLTGNQVACIALHHLCKTKPRRSDSAILKTIVTTELFQKIGADFGVPCIEVLTGFKYIGAKITDWERSSGSPSFLFGAEESCGSLYGNMARDKDAISASCLIAEIAAQAKKENKTLLDRLHELYDLYGIHRDLLVSVSVNPMEQLRKNPPSSIGSITVLSIDDFLKKTTDHPISDVLRFRLSDGSKIVIRPSGTEPKIKVYAEVVKKNILQLDRDIQNCDNKLKLLISELIK